MSLRDVHANAYKTYILPGVGKYACTTSVSIYSSYFSAQNPKHVHTSIEQMMHNIIVSIYNTFHILGRYIGPIWVSG